MENKKISTTAKTLGLAFIVILVLAACQPGGPVPTAPVDPYGALPPAAAAVTPTVVAAKVTVSDQSVDGGGLTIAQVDSPGAGWLVIHVQADGKPGAVLGYSAVKAGVNTNVAVTVDDSEATPVMYAMLAVVTDHAPVVTAVDVVVDVGEVIACHPATRIHPRFAAKLAVAAATGDFVGFVHRLDQDALRLVLAVAIARLQFDLPHDAGQTTSARLVGVFQDAVRVGGGESRQADAQQHHLEQIT